MKKRAIGAVVLVTLGVIFVSNQTKAQCPDASKKETAADCPWIAAGKSIAGQNDPTILRSILNEKVPGFMSKVDQDSKARDLIALWGLSKNWDENRTAQVSKIIPENLLRFIVSIWQVPYNETFTEGSAGLNHTYGYLFSDVVTKYGYKRARFVQGDIEKTFGLPAGLFGGIPSKGTLLSNFTKFIGTIAFRDNADCLKELTDAQESGKVTKIPELEKFPYRSLVIKRLVEIAKNDRFYLEMRSDLVSMPTTTPAQGPKKSLLVYSIDFHSQGQAPRPRLITAFPVEESFATGLFNPASLGEGVQLKLKYNAALPVSIPASDMMGKRFIANESN